MSARRLSQKQFMAALATCGNLYTAKECGCLVLVMLDIPEVVRDARDDILRESLAGRAIQRSARGFLPPFRCAAHEPVAVPA